MALERVHKILARAGIASRRKAEVLIEEGAVTINGEVAKLGDRAEWGKDAIKVSGKLLQYNSEAPLYIGLYKPRGVISMLADPEGRPTLADFISKVPTRVFPIGRLDFNSEGLIILTNDGAMAEKIQKSDLLPRIYEVKVKGHLDAASIKQLQKGAKVEDRMIKPHSVRISEELTSKSKVQVALVGSGAQDIKAFFEIKGFLVERITRTAIGNVTLSGLTPGQFKTLRPTQIQSMIDQPELGLRAFEAAAAKDVEKEESKAPKISIRPNRPGEEVQKREPRESRIGGRPGFGRNAERTDDKFSRKPRISSRDGERDSFGGDRKPRISPRDSEAPAPRGDRPSFGAIRKPRIAAREDGDAPTPRGDRPTFGAARKPRISARDGDGPAPRGDRPSFGEDRKPRFSSRDDKPSFGGPRKPSLGGPRKPSFGGGGKRGPSGFGRRAPRKRED